MSLTLQQRIEQKKELIRDLYRQIDNERKELWALQDQERREAISPAEPPLIDGDVDPTVTHKEA